MKSAKFDYAKTKDLYEALTALSDEESYVKVLAGSQSLGPMMNLRLVQPDRLIDIRGLEPLRKIERREDHLFVGALVTHAEIEDGRLPNTTDGMMAHVARGIGYRAVRNRGTIGGSIVHADPAADPPDSRRAKAPGRQRARAALAAHSEIARCAHVRRHIASRSSVAAAGASSPEYLCMYTRAPPRSGGGRVGTARGSIVMSNSEEWDITRFEFEETP